MTLHPEAQRKAQDELDRAIGRDRLPTFADRPNLPYVDALVKEVLRWNPVAPLGLPHVTFSDDVFEGYHIPKDSILLANIWYFKLPSHSSSVTTSTYEHLSFTRIGSLLMIPALTMTPSPSTQIVSLNLTPS